jgi:hypothetical protein
MDRVQRHEGRRGDRGQEDRRQDRDEGGVLAYEDWPQGRDEDDIHGPEDRLQDQDAVHVRGAVHEHEDHDCPTTTEATGATTVVARFARLTCTLHPRGQTGE